MRTIRSNSAFTLLELIVVVAIVGIVAMLATPSLARMRDKYRLMNVANAYAMSVNLTRIQAISENRVLRIYHHPDTAHADGDARNTVCWWDIQAYDDDNGVWETIPLDGFSGPPNYNQTGLYDFSTPGSPKHIPYISMESDVGGITDGTYISYSTRGTVNPDESAFSPNCYKYVGFRNKANNNLSVAHVCITASGIANLQS